MADEKSTPGALPLDKITGLLKDNWPSDDAAKPKDGESTIPTEAESMARRARKKYDGTLRWVLAVFSAVGLLIFGSVPFADLQDVNPTLLVAALILSGVGLGIVIWATTTGLEMQDASLGELARTFSEINDPPKIPTFWKPRKKANAILKTILEGTDAKAHLGPGVTKVQGLVDRLGDLEARAMQQRYAWNGDGNLDPTTVASSVAAASAKWARAKDELAALESALAEIRKQLVDTPDDDEAKSVFAALKVKYRAVCEALPDDTALAGEATATAVDELRQRYRDHRELVLDESLVAQMRGTFRVVRRWLMFGAALVLAGGTLFAYTVANPQSSEPKGAVSVTLKADEEPWNTVVKCNDDDTKEAVTLEGLLLSSDDDDGAQDGPFRFVATSGGCAGTSVSVEEGEGSYVKMGEADDAASGDSETASTEPTTGSSVTVTVKSNTTAWKALSKCRIGDDDVVVEALLYDSDDADGQQDGPFAATLVQGPCKGESVTVAEGDGLYTP